MFAAENVTIQFDYDSPEREDICRCLMTLYSTREGSQPLDRNFGLNWDFIDKPLPVAQQEYNFEVIKKTRQYESRVRVKEVSYSHKDGKIIPVITLMEGER